MEVPALETQLDANSLGSPAPPPIITPIFTPDALPATTLPICPGLGQAQEYAGLCTAVA